LTAVDFQVREVIIRDGIFLRCNCCCCCCWW